MIKLTTILEKNEENLQKPVEDLSVTSEEKERREEVAFDKYYADKSNRTVVPVIPEVKVYYNQNKWFNIKKEYLENPDINFETLALNHGIGHAKIIAAKAKEEDWEGQRLNILDKADFTLRQELEKEYVNTKKRHIVEARVMQKLGLTSMKRYPKLRPFEALKYVTEGVKIEREAYGLHKEQPKIVNIITQQQAIIDRYKIKNKKEEVSGEPSAGIN
mgnify:CR=1 FL=1